MLSKSSPCSSGLLATLARLPSPMLISADIDAVVEARFNGVPTPVVTGSRVKGVVIITPEKTGEKSFESLAVAHSIAVSGGDPVSTGGEVELLSQGQYTPGETQRVPFLLPIGTTTATYDGSKFQLEHMVTIHLRGCHSGGMFSRRADKRTECAFILQILEMPKSVPASIKLRDLRFTGCKLELSGGDVLPLGSLAHGRITFDPLPSSEPAQILIKILTIEGQHPPLCTHTVVAWTEREGDFSTCFSDPGGFPVLLDLSAGYAEGGASADEVLAPSAAHKGVGSTQHEVKHMVRLVVVAKDGGEAWDTLNVRLAVIGEKPVGAAKGSLKKMSPRRINSVKAAPSRGMFDNGIPDRLFLYMVVFIILFNPKIMKLILYGLLPRAADTVGMLDHYWHLLQLVDQAVESTGWMPPKK